MERQRLLLDLLLMKDPLSLVVFALDQARYALSVSAVERVVRAVEITPLPQTPDSVLGIVNVQGRIIPVMNVRRRFRLPERPVNLNDQLILARTSRRSVALLVDRVVGVVERASEQLVAPEQILPAVDYVAGVVKLPEGMVLIHDLDTFLSLGEERALDQAVQRLDLP